ncbi:MAG: hypothetical protein J7639_27595 [Paenibacillaceae bacterium]|nr:hypothetical protein [Paenibacillaceae bacterium]
MRGGFSEHCGNEQPDKDQTFDAQPGEHLIDSATGRQQMIQMNAAAGDTAVAALNFPYGSAGKIRISYKGLRVTDAKLILSECYLDPYHFSNQVDIVATIRETELHQCVVTELICTQWRWNTLDTSWDADLHHVHMRTNGSVNESTITKEDRIGRFSYAIVWLNDSDENDQILFIDQIEAESFRADRSGIPIFS